MDYFIAKIKVSFKKCIIISLLRFRQETYILSESWVEFQARLQEFWDLHSRFLSLVDWDHFRPKRWGGIPLPEKRKVTL